MNCQAGPSDVNPSDVVPPPSTPIPASGSRLWSKLRTAPVQEARERAAEEAQQRNIEHNNASMAQMTRRVQEVEEAQRSLVERAMRSEQRAEQLEHALEKQVRGWRLWRSAVE